MHSLLNGIDWGVVALYMIGMVAIGFIANKRVSGFEDHILSGRNVPTYYLAPCLLTTQIGASSIIGYVALSYSIGYSGGWWIIGNIFTFIVLGAIGAKQLRRAVKANTLPEWFKIRFDEKCRIFTAVATVIAEIAFTAGQIVGGAALISLVFGCSMFTGIFVFCIVVCLYSVFGGLWAVFLTDFVQMFVMIAGLTAIVIFGLQTTGGMTNLESMVPDGFFSLIQPGEIGTVIASVLYAIPAIFCSFDIIQKVMAARTPQVARNSCFWASGLVVFFAVVIPLIGILGYAILGPNVENTDAIMATLIVQILPTGLKGVAIAAILATLMSSTDACLMAGSAVFTNDLFPKFVNMANWNDTKKKKASMLATAVIMLICFGLAVALPNALSGMELAWTALSCGAFIPMIFGLLWKKTSSTGAFTSMICGATIGLIWKFMGNPMGLRPVIPAYIVGILVIVIVSLMKPQALTEEQAKDAGLIEA